MKYKISFPNTKNDFSFKKNKKYIVFFILISFVFLGAMCSKEEVKEEGYTGPFDGKQRENQITENENRDDNPKVSGDGETIIYFTDTDDNFHVDSLVVASPEGVKKTIKLIGAYDLLPEKSGLYIDSLDISRDGSTAAFVAVPFVENWWSVNPMFAYAYTLDLNKETLAKIDPQELPERVYPEEYDAERADASRVALSDDGKMLAFTVEVWGVDFGEIHDVIDDNMVLIAPSDGSREPSVLMKGISTYHVDMDSQGRVFYVKTDNEDYSKFELSVINSDGSNNKELGINLSFGGNWGLVVSSNGRVASLDRDRDVAFVCDANGTVIAETEDFYGSLAITGDGSRVLAYQTSTYVEKEERGLIYFNVDDNFSVEQILSLEKLTEEDWVINGTHLSASDSGGVLAAEMSDGRYGDKEILSVYWEK